MRSLIQSGATIRIACHGTDYDELTPPSSGPGYRHRDWAIAIDRALIDKSSRIADGVVITPKANRDLDAGNYSSATASSSFRKTRDSARSGFSPRGITAACDSGSAVHSLPLLCSFQGGRFAVPAGSAISGGCSFEQRPTACSPNTSWDVLGIYNDEIRNSCHI